MRVHHLALGLSLFSALCCTQPAAAQEPIAPGEQGVEIACDVCLPTSAPAGPLQINFRPGFQLGVDHQFTPFKDLRYNGDKIDNPSGEKIVTNTTQVQVLYNASPRAGFIVTVPFLNRSYRRQTSGGGTESGSVSGLGDMIVRGRYAVIYDFHDDHTILWTVEAGLKLPTGDSRLLRDHGVSHGNDSHAEPDSSHDGHDHEGHDHDEHHEHEDEGLGQSLGHNHGNSAIAGHDLALGTGSVDGVIGTGLLLRKNRLYFTGGAQYLLRSTGTAGYRYGDLITWRVAPGYLLLSEDNQVLGLQLNVSGEHHDPNRIYQVKEHGYTDIIYAGPEVSYQKNNLSLNLGLDLPIKYYSEGRTLAPEYRARFAFNWRF